MGGLSPLPYLTLDDKTKADPITKSLVCVQAGWFIVQCIARLTTDLPITLFEIHILAHVLVAFCMYLLWFSKPYNSLSLVTLEGPDAVDATALLLLSNGDLKERNKDSPADYWKCVLKDSIEADAARRARYFEVDGRWPGGERPFRCESFPAGSSNYSAVPSKVRSNVRAQEQENRLLSSRRESHEEYLFGHSSSESIRVNPAILVALYKILKRSPDFDMEYAQLYRQSVDRAVVRCRQKGLHFAGWLSDGFYWFSRNTFVAHRLQDFKHY